MRNTNYKVYKHTAPNGKVYIGITCLPLNTRWGKDGCNYNTQKVFYRAIQKYGWANFKHEVMCENLSKDEAKSKEIYYIDLYKSNYKKYNNPAYGYNASDGGDNVDGHPMSAKSREALMHRIKESQKQVDVFDLNGKYLTTYNSFKETSDILGISVQSVNNCCYYHRGSRRCKDYMLRLNSETQGKDIPPYSKNTWKSSNVIVFELNGNIYKKFDCPTIAAKEMNIDLSSICRCMKNQYYQAGGYIFEKDMGQSSPIKEMR